MRLARTAFGLLAGAAALVGAGGGWLAHIGYFGAAVFAAFPATAAPRTADRGVVAVLLSGDLGLGTGMARGVAQLIAGHGIPVLGIDSRAYFRRERRPAAVRELVDAAMRRALRVPHANRLLLVGQSFGADMLHVGLAGLDPALRRRVAFVALVVPGDAVIFHASPTELLDLDALDGPALPTAARLTWAPGLCIYGADETDSLCPLLHQPNIVKVALPGGHPLRRDRSAVFAAVWSGFTRAAAAASQIRPAAPPR